MKRIAFLANSFHLHRTHSSDFFVEFLRDSFSLPAVIPHSEAWARLPGRKWDLVVVWQKHYDARELRAFPADRVVVVPMYDDTRTDADYWRGYEDFKIVCFSSTLEQQLRPHRLRLLGARYYPEPLLPLRPGTFGEKPRGFFWPRSSGLGWETIARLIGHASFSRMQVHWTPTLHPEVLQPGRGLPPGVEKIEISTWTGRRDDYLGMLRGSNVFFAPRRKEGIGMSFLEAMALGMCVVAPDAATMNEYIRDGQNGILYDPDHPRALDFGRVKELGAAARSSVVQGRAAWESSLAELRRFLEEPVAGYHRRLHLGIRIRRRSFAVARAIYRRFKYGRRFAEA